MYFILKSLIWNIFRKCPLWLLLMILTALVLLIFQSFPGLLGSFLSM